MPAEIPEVPFASAKAWEKWLDKHHAETAGIWMKIARKESGIPSITYKEALSVALCYGWIDGQKAASTGGYWLQRFTPRRKKSKWSQVNRAAALLLIEAGKMLPPGLLEVEAAKADGRWEAAYAPQSSIQIPEDFIAALDKDPEAKAFFATLNGTNRYAMLYRIHDAKRPETRARRIATFIEMLRDQKTIHPLS